MFHRIISAKGCSTSNTLLLTIYRDDDDKDCVMLLAFHNHPNDDTIYIQEDRIYADDLEILKSLIEDYSTETATAYLNGFTF